MLFQGFRLKLSDSVATIFLPRYTTLTFLVCDSFSSKTRREVVAAKNGLNLANKLGRLARCGPPHHRSARVGAGASLPPPYADPLHSQRCLPTATPWYHTPPASNSVRSRVATSVASLPSLHRIRFLSLPGCDARAGTSRVSISASLPYIVPTASIARTSRS